MNMRHYLKTDSAAFISSTEHGKSYELRYDDRMYKVGDVLVLRETVHTGAEMKTGEPLVYTEKEHTVIVKHILRGPIYGLAAGWVIMSVVPLPPEAA